MYGITIVRSLPFSFLDDGEGTANISVSIRSGSTVSASHFEGRGDTSYLSLRKLVSDCLSSLSLSLSSVSLSFDSLDNVLEKEQTSCSRAYATSSEITTAGRDK